MITQLAADDKITVVVHEIAARYGVGTPLKRPQRRVIQIIYIVLVILIFILAAWLCYIICGAIAFIFITYIYPSVDTVPTDQLDNYFRLRAIHDNIWMDLFQAVVSLFNALTYYILFARFFLRDVYVCTDGLLIIHKQEEAAMRWDEVREIYTTNGRVTRLVAEDGRNFVLPFLLMGGHNRPAGRLIAEETMRHLQSKVRVRYERWEDITFRDLKATRKGLFKSGKLVCWDELIAVRLDKKQFSICYLSPGKISTNDMSLTTDQGTWYVWQKRGIFNSIRESRWPNLQIFVALVNSILAERKSKD